MHAPLMAPLLPAVMPRKAKAVTYPLDTPFSDFPTLALERLANALSRHGELMYMRLFGLHLSECRVLAVVITREPTNLSEVCEQIELDKGHVSRLVTRLIASGLLERHVDATDQRSAHLVLTAAGRELTQRLQSAAAARNSDWMTGLREDESAAFMAGVRKMTQQVHRMLADEMQRSGGMTVPALANSREAGAKRTRVRRSVVIERRVLEDMRRQLDLLLAQGSGAPPQP